MIIKVNLLPRHYAEQRVVIKLIVFFLLAFVGTFAFMAVSYNNLKAELANKTQEAADMRSKASMVEALQGQTSTVQGLIPPIKAKTKFIKDVDDANDQWAKLLETLAKYTYSKVIYTQIAPSQTSITIDANADNVSTIGRYLLGMLRCPEFSYVSINQVPGFPKGTDSGGSSSPSAGMGGGMPGGAPGGGPGGGMPGALPAVSSTPTDIGSMVAGRISFQVVCTLKTGLTTPAYSGAAGVDASGGGMPGGGAPGGMPGGSPGGMPGGSPGGMPGGSPGGMPGGSPGGAPMAGAIPAGTP